MDNTNCKVESVRRGCRKTCDLCSGEQGSYIFKYLGIYNVHQLIKRLKQRYNFNVVEEFEFDICSEDWREKVLTVPGDIIHTPNYPKTYDSGKKCQITIKFAKGDIVSIQFITFSLEPDDNCTLDWLEVRDGDTDSAKLLGKKLCGNKIPTTRIVSTGNALTLVFHTDDKENFGGFKIMAELGSSNYYKAMLLVLFDLLIYIYIYNSLYNIM